MDTLTFIDELVGILAWPAAVVAVAWAARGPLLALAGRRRRPLTARSATAEEKASPLDQEVGTGDDAGAAPATRGGSGDLDGDARADQAALLGASLAVVLTQFFGAGAWGWWSTGIGLTLLLVVLGYFRILRDPRLDWPRRVMRLLGFAAVIGLCSTVALAYGLQTLQLRGGSKTPGTNERSVEDFCKNLGVAAGSKAVDEADKKFPLDPKTKRSLDQKTKDEVLSDARKAAADEATDNCRGEYGSTHLGLVGLGAGLLAFLIGAITWRPREPRSPSVDPRSSESRRKNGPAGLAPGEAGMNEGAQVEAITKTYDDLAKACLAAFELRDRLLGRIGPRRLTAVQRLPQWTREDWRKHVTDPASPELCAAMDEVAKEDEKKEWFFSSVIATYWLEALAEICCARFHLDANRTASLSKIQLARERELEPVGRQRRIASVIIAAAGFIATQVPLETFTAFGFTEHDYGIYRLVVVGVVVVLLAFTLLYPRWLLTGYDREKTRRRTANAMTGVLLTYCAIRCSSDD